MQTKNKILTMKENNKHKKDIERARTFLNHHKKYMDIHDETGLGYFWLQRFAKGKIVDPRASLLFRLLDYIDNNAKKTVEKLKEIDE